VSNRTWELLASFVSHSMVAVVSVIPVTVGIDSTIGDVASGVVVKVRAVLVGLLSPG